MYIYERDDSKSVQSSYGSFLFLFYTLWGWLVKLCPRRKNFGQSAPVLYSNSLKVSCVELMHFNNFSIPFMHIHTFKKYMTFVTF